VNRWKGSKIENPDNLAEEQSWGAILEIFLKDVRAQIFPRSDFFQTFAVLR